MGYVSIDEDFFKSKRRWSRIKDQILGAYLPVYLAKVATLPYPIILVDAFAGPGGFLDKKTGEQSDGSPVIMCKEAEKYAKERYIAYFGNNKKKLHQQLTSLLENKGNLISRGIAKPIFGDNKYLLKMVQENLTNQTILVYLDPFGVKGCEFETTVKPFLLRSKDFSTEIIINISVPILYRLAAYKAVKKGKVTPLINSYHETLNKVLGGDWWKEILWNESLTPEKQAWEIIQRYTNQLKKYLPYTGFCPVREREGARLKYFITFCSRRFDAMERLNDIMCEVYNNHIEDMKNRGTLWEDYKIWKDNRPHQILENIILEKVTLLGPKNRQYLLEQVVLENFMIFTSSEFNNQVSKMIRAGQLEFIGTKRLNKDSIISLARQGRLF